MDQNDIKTLIDTFKGYRDLLTPIQDSLHSFTESFSVIKDDMERLNSLGNVSAKLDSIYKRISEQGEQAAELSNRIEKFVKVSEKYAESAAKIGAVVEQAEERLKAIRQIENKALDQIKKLDELLEDKKNSYDVKELQKSLEVYNSNVQKVSEFINKDIAVALNQNYSKLDQIKLGSDALMKRVLDEGTSISDLAASYKATGELLKKTVEKGDVNEEYIFEILDRWADDRKVKRKK